MVAANKTVVLLVDDDPEIVPVVRQGLAPFDVLTASTVAEARAKLKERPVDVILLDVSLPDVDGFTFCQELVSDQNFRRIPIVMISGRGEVSDIVFGLNSGADDYVAKPIKVCCITPIICS
jgi:DNA-binding response OmpR family regulator